MQASHRRDANAIHECCEGIHSQTLISDSLRLSPSGRPNLSNLSSISRCSLNPNLNHHSLSTSR